MPAFHTDFSDLPRDIPVFPLPGALLLPHGRLPLNIFEPRYMALAQDSLGRGRLFGMVQPDPAAPAGPTGPGLYRTGCLGRLSSFAETEDGRLLVTLTGVIRYDVLEELPLHPGGYRRVRAGFRTFATDLEPPPAAAPIDRQALFAALRGYFRARRLEVNWEAVEQTADAMLVTTLAMVCPFDVEEKQALLEAPDVSERARMLIALMEMGVHGAPPGIRPS